MKKIMLLRTIAVMVTIMMSDVEASSSSSSSSSTPRSTVSLSSSESGYVQSLLKDALWRDQRDTFNSLLMDKADPFFMVGDKKMPILNEAIKFIMMSDSDNGYFYLNKILDSYPNLLEFKYSEDKDRTSLLHLVVYFSKKHFEYPYDKTSNKMFNIAKILLEKGADISAVDRDGYNAFDYAEGKVPGYKGDLHVLKLLNEAKESRKKEEAKEVK
jgi:hypothetical protein